MRIDVVTLFPEVFEPFAQLGVVGRAITRGLAQLHCWNPRDYAEDARGTVDDRSYGGGPGMVMMAPQVCAAIDAALAATGPGANPGERPIVAFLSPEGRRLDQKAAGNLAARSRLVLLAGRYEGVDQRVLDSRVDEVWSIGDYVLSGGELPAMVLIDAVMRLQPGALGDDRSVLQDSFMNGLLDHAHYTRPESFEGRSVPQVLQSGNHQAIELWRMRDALSRTWRLRPDLLVVAELEDHQRNLLEQEVVESAHGRS